MVNKSVCFSVQRFLLQHYSNLSCVTLPAKESAAFFLLEHKSYFIRAGVAHVTVNLFIRHDHADLAASCVMVGFI